MHMNAAIGYYQCPVCNRRHSEYLLQHAQAKAIFTRPEEFLGWALCERDETLFLQGFVALIEVEDEPEGADPIEQLANAERTGNVFHVLRERWGTIFLAPPPDMPLQFISPEAVADARESSRLSLH